MKHYLGGLSLAALLLVGSVAAPLTAQVTAPAPSTPPVVANRVMAIVGKMPITESMVDEELFSRVSDPAERASWTPEVLKENRRRLVDTLVDAEMMFQEAVQDTSIHVTDAEVGETVEATLKQYRLKMPTPGQFEAELTRAGFRSVDEFRTRLFEQEHRRLYVERFSAILHENGAIKPLNPTEKEMRAFYDAQVAAGRMSTIDSSISFRQIVIAPKPSPTAMAKARKTIDSLIVALRNGADFQTVARQYSMDPASRDRGGDYGWHRRGAGEFVREFEDAAFALKPGTISEPVITPYGIHIIQVTRVQPNEAHIYHILIMPDVDSTTVAAAAREAADIRAALERGAAFDSVQRLVHDMTEARGTDGLYPIDSLLPMYAPLRTLEVGKLSPVIVLPVDSVRSKQAIVLLTGRYPQGPVPYDTVREAIRTGLANQNGQDAYIKELRTRMYVDIRSQ